MNSKVKQMVVDRLETMKTVQGSKGVIILFDGKQLIMESGKRIWSERRHASCALSNHLNMNYELYKETGDKSIRVSMVIKELEKEGIIEFKTLE